MQVELEKADWPRYLDSLTRALAAATTEIEVAALPSGAGIDSPRILLAGIRYYPHADCVDIALELADKAVEDYVIEGPRRICVDADPAGLSALEIRDRAGIVHRVELRQALPLTA